MVHKCGGTRGDSVCRNSKFRQKAPEEKLGAGTKVQQSSQGEQLRHPSRWNDIEESFLKEPGGGRHNLRQIRAKRGLKGMREAKRQERTFSLGSSTGRRDKHYPEAGERGVRKAYLQKKSPEKINKKVRRGCAPAPGRHFYYRLENREHDV